MRTRQRTKESVIGDGGCFDIQHRPPAEHLPDGFADLLAEYDRISRDLAKSRNDAAQWRRSREADEHAAIQADARAAGEAARAGKKLPNPTASLDQVRARLQEATGAIPALEVALDLIRLDLQAARDKAQQADDPTAVPNARNALAEAADHFNAALEDYLTALAKSEWLHEHMPWDTSAQLVLASLPGIGGLVDVRITWVSAAALIKTIAAL